MEKLSIIIPAYNEEKRIGNTLLEYSKFFRGLKKKKILDFEILVVINGTTDNTEGVVKKYQKKFKEILCMNRLDIAAKGLAIIEGFKDALTRENTLIGFVDADMATPPEAYYELFKNLGRYGGVIASRYVKGSRVFPKQSVQRVIVSRIFNILIRSCLLIPQRDTQCGAKLFQKEVVEKILPELKMSKWAFDVDLIFAAHKIGYKIKEQKTIWGDKEDSKINFMKAGPMMGLAVIRLRILNSPFKGMITFYDKIVSKILWGIFK
jgi:glycosyltransferase involved in cell wall biosynthesis